jgi:CRP-like cAMP-binding protein
MKNHILRALPPRELKFIVPQLKAVDLEKGAVLFEAGEPLPHVFFPAGAMASYLSSTSEGQTIEVCVIGNEGIIGGSSLLFDIAAFRAVVQIAGPAFRLNTDVLRQECKRCEVLYSLLLTYSNALLIQVAQTAVCNKFHSVEERFCRWLLLAQDRSGSDQLTLTQDGLARILGTRRASVTVVAGMMQKAGLIRYSRGVITILDRPKLELAACECYETIAAAYSYVAQKQSS